MLSPWRLNSADHERVMRGDASSASRRRIELTHYVMPGLVPGIHALLTPIQDVDDRTKSGHEAA
jgi:hypothetical protein